MSETSIFPCFKYFRRNAIIVNKEVKVLGNPKYVRQALASISNTNGVAKITLTFDLTVTLEAPIQWSVSIMHKENEVFIRSFLNANIEICSFFRTGSMNPLFQQIYANARQFGKVPSRCPIKRDTYFVKDFIFDVNILPQILPSNQLRFDYTIEINAD
jgi:Protein of unknown function (DUF1091)